MYPRVLLTSNMDCSDRLINDHLGYIYYFDMNKDTLPKLYIKYDDENTGLRATQTKTLQKYTMLPHSLE